MSVSVHWNYNRKKGENEIDVFHVAMVIRFVYKNQFFLPVKHELLTFIDQTRKLDQSENAFLK